MKTWIVKYRLELAGILVGALGGWCYWYFVGCASGQCPITSKPLNSGLYGAVMGALLFSLMRRNPERNLDNKINEKNE